MAFTEALRMLITADTGQAVTSIQKVGQVTNKELGGSSKTIDKWSRGLTVAGAGMVAFGSAALVGLGMAAKSASDLGEAVNASQVVFGRASGTIDKFAEDSATSMGLSERAFRQALVPIGAMLQNFGFSQEDAADKSVELAQRAADMASVFNTDVNEALAAIQAGLRGEMDPLERFGVGLNEAAVNAKAMELGLATSTGEVDAAAKAQARLALIFEQTDKFAGDFANTSDSLANRQRILSAQFENLKAAIGEGALPVFETMVDVASKGIGVFDGLNDATGGAAGKIAAIGSLALIAGGSLSFMVGQGLKMRQSFKDLAGILSGLSGKLSALKFVAGPTGVAGALFAAGAGMALFLRSQNQQELLKSAEAFAKLDKVTKEAAASTGVLNDAVRVSTIDFTAGASVQEEFARTGEVTAEVMRDLDKAWDQIISKNPELAEGFIRSAEKIGVSKDKLQEWRGELDNQISNAGEAAKAQEDYNAKVAEAAGVTEEATSALQEYSDELAAMVDPIFAAMDAITDVRDAQVAEAEAARGVMEAQAALNEARKGGKADEIAEAERGLADAQRQLSDAQWATVESAAQADAALAGLKDAVDNGDVSVAEFRDTLALWVRQGFLTQDQADRAAKSVGGLASEAENADKKRVDIPVATPGSEPSRERLRRVKDAVGMIPNRKHVSVMASSNVSGVVRGVISALNRIPSLTTTVIRAQLQGSIRPGIQVRQHGGPVRKGEAYVVGERRAEVFVPDRNGMILPSVNHLGHMGAGGGAMTVHLQISGSGRLAREVHEGVRAGDIQLFANGQRVTVR